MPAYVQPFQPDALRCPKCGQLLHGVTAGTGSFALRCENRVPTSPPRREQGTGRLLTEACGQYVHVTCLEGVAYVAPIPREVYAAYRAAQEPAGSVYRAAGILPTYERPEVAPHG